MSLTINFLSVKNMAICSETWKMFQLQEQNNFRNRFVFPSRDRTLSKGWNKTFRQKSVKISDFGSDHKFSKCQEHGNLLRNLENVSTSGAK